MVWISVSVLCLNLYVYTIIQYSYCQTYFKETKLVTKDYPFYCNCSFYLMEKTVTKPLRSMTDAVTMVPNVSEKSLIGIKFDLI